MDIIFIIFSKILLSLYFGFSCGVTIDVSGSQPKWADWNLCLASKDEHFTIEYYLCDPDSLLTQHTKKEKEIEEALEAYLENCSHEINSADPLKLIMEFKFIFFFVENITQTGPGIGHSSIKTLKENIVKWLELKYLPVYLIVIDIYTKQMNRWLSNSVREKIALLPESKAIINQTMLDKLVSDPLSLVTVVYREQCKVIRNALFRQPFKEVNVLWICLSIMIFLGAASLVIWLVRYNRYVNIVSGEDTRERPQFDPYSDLKEMDENSIKGSSHFILCQADIKVLVPETPKPQAYENAIRL